MSGGVEEPSEATGKGPTWATPWVHSVGHVYLGAFVSPQETGDIPAETRADMHALVDPANALVSISLMVKWGEHEHDCDYGQCDINDDGFWDVIGSDHIQYAALQYFANHHRNYWGINTIMEEGVLTPCKKTVN